MKHTMPTVLVMCLFVFCNGCTGTPAKDNADFIGQLPPQSLGTLHLNIVKRYTNELLARDVTIVFYPGSNTVTLLHKMMGDNIWIHLNSPARAQLRQAIQEYLTAFSDKVLTPEGSKKYGAFGQSNVYMTWGLWGAAHEAEPVLRFDYQFITPQRPYFILAAAMEKASDGTNSPAIRIAVSPAQCKDLLAVLDEPALEALANEIKAEYGKFDLPDNTSDQKPAADNENTKNNAPLQESTVQFDEF